MRICLPAVLLFVTASVAATPAAAQRRDSADVVRAIAAYDAAWAAKDTAAVGRWLAPAFRYFSSTGEVWPRERLLGLLGDPAYRVEHAARTALEPRVTGGTAVVASRWQGRGTWSGGRFEDDQRCSLVLVREGAAWRLVAEHCTAIAPGPVAAADTAPAAVVQRFVDAANARDAAAMAALVAPEAVFARLPDGRVFLQGRDRVEAHYTRLLSGLSPEFRIRVEPRIVEGRLVIDQEHFTGAPGEQGRATWMYQVSGGLIRRAWVLDGRAAAGSEAGD